MALRRLLRSASVTIVVAAICLGLLPRAAVGRRVPPTVIRTQRVSVGDLVPRTPGAHVTSTAVRIGAPTWTIPRTTCAPITFTTVGILWKQDGSTEVPTRLAWGEDADLGQETRVVADPNEGPDPGSVDDRGVVGTPPVWTGDATCLRYRLLMPAGERVSSMRLMFINTSGTATDRSPLASIGAAILGFLDGLGAAEGPTPAQAWATRPGIITREAWGADEDLRRCEPEYADRIKMAYVHHTSGANDYTRAEADDVVRGIYAYHTNGRHYCDIAYHFLVDRFGRVYEGRYGGMNEPVIGAHAMGFNTGTVGVAVMGNFVSHRPPARVIRALKHVLAWRLDIAHVDPTARTWMVSAGGSTTRYEEGERVRLRTISGHMDTGITDCPGRRLYRRLDAIRRGALAIGLPKMWRPRQSAAGIVVGESTVEWTARLSSRLDWTIEVENADGAVVRDFAGRADHVAQSWDGTAKLGLPVPDGRYAVTLRARDDQGRRARPRRFFVRVSSVP